MILPYPVASSKIDVKSVVLFPLLICSLNNLPIVSSVINGASPQKTATVPFFPLKNSIALLTA